MSRLSSSSEPDVFVMENVPELLRSTEFVTFKDEAGPDGLGFTIRERVLVAADYGVPQLRRRAIVIGSKVGEPPWPIQSTGQAPIRLSAIRSAGSSSRT